MVFHAHGFTLSPSQQKVLAMGGRVRMHASHLSGPHHIHLSGIQKRKAMRGMQSGKGFMLGLSPTQIKYNVQRGGGWWSDAGNWFKGAANSVGNAAKSAAHTVGDAAEKVGRLAWDNRDKIIDAGKKVWEHKDKIIDAGKAAHKLYKGGSVRGGSFRGGSFRGGSFRGGSFRGGSLKRPRKYVGMPPTEGTGFEYPKNWATNCGFGSKRKLGIPPPEMQGGGMRKRVKGGPPLEDAGGYNPTKGNGLYATKGGSPFSH